MDDGLDYSKIYSNSKIKLYFECPKKYHFSHIDPVFRKKKYVYQKLPENIYPFQTMGKSVHNAITLFFYLPREEKSQDNLLEILHKTWRSDAYPFKEPPLGEMGGFKSSEEENESYTKCEHMLEYFYKRFDMNYDFEFLPTNNLLKSIDDYKKLVTPLNEDVDISGKFDAVLRENNELNIIDFKTGQKEESDNFQLRFYTLLAELKFKKRVTKANYYYLALENRKEFDPTSDSVEAIRKAVVDKINTIRNTTFYETKPKSLCKYCVFKNDCPDKTKVLELLKSPAVIDIPEDLPF